VKISFVEECDITVPSNATVSGERISKPKRERDNATIERAIVVLQSRATIEQSRVSQFDHAYRVAKPYTKIKKDAQRKRDNAVANLAKLRREIAYLTLQVQ
jgi:hypothetical protein